MQSLSSVSVIAAKEEIIDRTENDKEHASTKLLGIVINYFEVVRW
jgi:hypothetical protein